MEDLRYSADTISLVETIHHFRAEGDARTVPATPSVRSKLQRQQRRPALRHEQR